MDLAGAERTRQDLEERWRKGPGPGGLEEDLLPSKMCHFDEIIPISAKFSPSTVSHLSDRLRHWTDVHEAERSEERVVQLGQELERTTPGQSIY